MADIVLSTVDLDVFGGPTSLDVSVDFGQTGTRGSRIWGGTDPDPAVELINQPFILYDWYLNTISGRISQYVPQAGVPTWTPAGSFALPQYSAIASSTFTTGSTTINIPISELTDDVGTTIADYAIRYNIANANPVATSFTAAIVSTNIAITINAIEYSGGSWSDLTGSKNVHLFVSYIG